MEELGDSRHFHIDYDPGVLSHHLRWSAGAHDHGMFSGSAFTHYHFIYTHIFCVFFHADPAGSGQMLRRDHLHRLSSVSHPRAAMVPQSFLVFLADIQLLFLRRKSGRLLWCCDKSCGIFAYTRQIPSILFVHILLHWLCVVCAVSSQKVLYETIQFVRLDTCGIADCCHTELSHHSEYFRRWVLSFASELSFFCDWIFKLMKLCVCTLQAWFGSLCRCRWSCAMMWWRTCLDSSSGAHHWLSLARRRHGRASLAAVCRPSFLALRSPMFCARISSLYARLSTVKAPVVQPANRATCSDHKSIRCHLWVYLIDRSFEAVVAHIVCVFFLFHRSTSTKLSSCIHSSCIRCRWACSARSSDHLVVSLRLDSRELSKSK